MLFRAAGIGVAGLLAAVTVVPVSAQPYGFPPGMGPYFDGPITYRPGSRVVRDENGTEMVVNRRGRVLYYLDENGQPVRAYGRHFVRMAPGPYDDEQAPARPYFADPGDGRAAPSGIGIGVPRQPADQQAYQQPGYPQQSYPQQSYPQQRYQPQIMQPEQESPADAQAPYQESSLSPNDGASPGPAKELSPELRRQMVAYNGKEPAGTIIIDTAHTFLYLVEGNGQAMRYGIGVGREGFTWSGREKISRMAEWPDWYPPEEMIQRQPYLPRMMAGGPSNPLGARALYLGNTLYRIHGTNDPTTIGKYVSSGCIRLTNQDVEDLYQRVHVGTRVVVLPGGGAHTAKARTGKTHATASAQR